MRRNQKRSSQCGQATLIGLLIAIAILMILYAIYVPQIAARHSAEGQARTPTERALGAACGAYASQMNDAVVMYKTDNGSPPTSLDQLKKYGVTDDMIHAEGCYYQMDPATGEVRDVGGGQYQPGTSPVLPTTYGQDDSGQNSGGGQQPNDGQGGGPQPNPYAAPPGAPNPAPTGAYGMPMPRIPTGDPSAADPGN
jgi:competence protein ComGC